MKIALIVFSGTGNTLRVGKMLKEELFLLGHETMIFPLKEGFAFPTQPFDLYIFAYPVHAFNAPKNFLKFLKSLPRGDGNTPYCLLRTSGEPLKINDASGITPARILKKKGYTLQSEYSAVMPYNIIFRHSDGMAARMDHAAKIRMKIAAIEISQGVKSRTSVGISKRFVSFVLKIEHPAMPLLGKTFHAGKSCVGCGACVKFCPQGNIRMDGERPKFSTKCVGCMACAFTCPRDAIKISLLNGWRVNGAYDFSSIPATDGEVCKYLRKSYLKYFHETETLSRMLDT